jgi:hypothetical protein
VQVRTALACILFLRAFFSWQLWYPAKRNTKVAAMVRGLVGCRSAVIMRGLVCCRAVGCADLLVAAQQLPRGLFLHASSSGHVWSPAGRKMKDGPEQWSGLE